jgi:hypothetical protein
MAPFNGKSPWHSRRKANRAALADALRCGVWAHAFLGRQRPDKSQQMDPLGFEPRAFRMRSGGDATKHVLAYLLAPDKSEPRQEKNTEEFALAGKHHAHVPAWASLAFVWRVLLLALLPGLRGLRPWARKQRAHERRALQFARGVRPYAGRRFSATHWLAPWPPSLQAWHRGLQACSRGFQVWDRTAGPCWARRGASFANAAKIKVTSWLVSRS